MIHIENDTFSAGIQLKGAELASLVHKATGREWMWSADPEIWGNSAPILFPIVGFIHPEETLIDGKPYAIPKHGILRGRDATLVEQGGDYAVFQFQANDETLALYPFGFRFLVRFQLLEQGLQVDYSIQNDGAEDMLFSVGSHPAFALDLEQNRFEDYEIVFEEAEELDLYGLENNLMVLKQESYLNQESRIQLSETLFHDDALVFKQLRSRKVSLMNTRTGERLDMDLREAPHLGIWAKAGAAYVCIEPWYTTNDAADSDGKFENKDGVMRMPPGESFETGYTVTLS